MTAMQLDISKIKEYANNPIKKLRFVDDDDFIFFGFNKINDVTFEVGITASLNDLPSRVFDMLKEDYNKVLFNIVRYYGGYVASIYAQKVNGKWRPVENCEQSKGKDLATCWDIPNYYDFRKGVFNGKKGYFYTLSQKLKQEDKERLLEKYINIDFLISQLQYAPEITHNVIFLSNEAN